MAPPFIISIRLQNDMSTEICRPVKMAAQTSSSEQLRPIEGRTAAAPSSERSGPTGGMSEAAPSSGQLQLEHQLNGVQVLSIVLSAIIGSGVFSGNNEALAVAGPVGLILAVVILGAIAAMVAETVSQFVQLFPAPNAVYEYVSAFVDKDLAWVVGFAYWYCFTAVFATQMSSAVKLLYLWQVDDGLDLTPTGGLPVWLFYSFIPFLLFLINLIGVKLFGWVETFGGFAKSFIVVFLTSLLYGIAVAKHHSDPNYSNPIRDAFNGVPLYARNWWEALCIAFPGVAFGYIGIESTVMAAFEADPGDQHVFGVPMPKLGWASRLVHWIVVALYFFYTLGVALTVPWNNVNLVPTYGLMTKDGLVGEKLNSANSIIIAMSSWRGTNTPAGRGIVNSLLIFCILSAANTSLYIASRTLWGLARHGDQESPLLGKLVQRLGGVWQATSVPLVALLWSLLAFLSWFPATQFSPNASKVAYVLSSTASMSCLIVWAALCLAFINYYRETRQEGNRELLSAASLNVYIADSKHYGKKSPKVLIAQDPSLRHVENIPPQGPRIQNIFNKSYRWTAGLPIGASLGLAGCMCVFAFALGDRWDNPEDSVVKAIAAYGAHAVCLITFGGMKLWRRFQGTHASSDDRNLAQRIETLEIKCIKSYNRQEDRVEGIRTSSAMMLADSGQQPRPPPNHAPPTLGERSQ